MELKNKILESLKDHFLLEDFMMKKAEDINATIGIIIKAYKNNKKVLICGNGGSAADAQHLAGELVGRFKKERKGLAAIALTTDSSVLSSLGNDYGFDKVFERQVEALGNEGDVLIGITTSGNSRNIILAFEAAKQKNIKTILLNGKDGGILKGKCDAEILIESKETARVQEMHILCIHIICEIVEEHFS